MLLRQAYWKAACPKQTEHTKQQQEKTSFKCAKGERRSPQSLSTGHSEWRLGTTWEQGWQWKGDTAAVTTWAEKLLHGLSNTVVTTRASPSNS